MFPIPVSRGFLTGYPIRAQTGRQVHTHPENTGSLTTTAARCYAVYWGRVSQPVNAVDVFAYINGVAAATTGYAEIGVGTSTASDLYVSSVDITPLGYADIDAAVKGGATQSTRGSITGVSIPANRDIWSLVVASYDVTQASFRTAGNGGGDTRGYARIAASTRISTNIGSAVAFTWTVGTAQVTPFLSLEIR